MSKDAALGVLLGAFLVASTVIGNIQRGDPHLVSTHPGLISLIVAPVVVFEVTRRYRRAGSSAVAAASFGTRVSLIAAIVFSLGSAIFTIVWLPSHTVSLAIFAFGAAFLITFASGWCAAHLGSRVGAADDASRAPYP